LGGKSNKQVRGKQGMENLRKKEEVGKGGKNIRKKITRTGQA